MVAIVKALGHEKVDVLGYSMRGGVALRMAIQKPDSVRRLVLVSMPSAGGLQDAGWWGETMSQNRLAIFPDLTHYDIFTSPRLVNTVMPFLNSQSDAKPWVAPKAAAQ